MSAILGWSNHVKTGSVVVGNAAAGLGAGNLQDDSGSPAVAWQTTAGVLTSAAGATATITPPGAAQTWRAVSLHRTNLTPTASVSVKLYTGVSTLVYSGVFSGVAAGYGQLVCILPADTVADYAVVGVDNVGNPDGFLNIPLIYAGPAWLPLSGVSWATAAGRDSASLEIVTRGGQEIPTPLWQRRRWDVDMQGLRASEVWAQAGTLDAAARRGGNVLFAPDTASANLNSEAVFGRASALSDVTFPYAGADRRAWRVRVSERL